MKTLETLAAVADLVQRPALRRIMTLAQKNAPSVGRAVTGFSAFV